MYCVAITTFDGFIQEPWSMLELHEKTRPTEPDPGSKEGQNHLYSIKSCRTIRQREREIQYCTVFPVVNTLYTEEWNDL